MSINSTYGSSDLSQSRLAVDTGGVNDLKQAAHQNSPEAVKGAAKQFEAMLINTLMKSMRDATPQDGPMDSEQGKMFTSMLDQQLSQTMAQRGIGLADVLTRQLSGNLPKPALGSSDNAAMQQALGVGKDRDDSVLPFSRDRLASLMPSSLNADTHGRDSNLPINQMLMNADRNTSTDSDGRRRNQQRPAHVEAFQSKLAKEAEEASQTTGIPARFMIAQAALESGWGKHVINHRDGSSSHNLFGIKATSSWKGKTVQAVTTEYVNGVAQRKVEKFRAYDSYADSFRDYASLLRNNPRYEKVLASAQDMTGFAQGLQRAGYATDPRYAEKLTRIIKQQLSA